MKECSITQESFKENQEITQLPCKHIFETDSIIMWLKEESHRCPVCRYELDFKEICETIPTQTNNETESNEDITDSDDDMPELEEDFEAQHQNIINERQQILSNLNNLIQNIHIVGEPRNLSRRSSFEVIDTDLQQALLESMNEEKNEDFITHPDTQHDLNFNEVLSDSDSDLDDDLNSVD